MTNEIEIEALRPFNKTPQGDLCEVGDRFPVGEARADELERLGLARPVSGVKQAPKPDNKMAPAPARKGRPPRLPELPAETPRSLISTQAQPLAIPPKVEG